MDLTDEEIRLVEAWRSAHDRLRPPDKENPFHDVLPQLTLAYHKAMLHPDMFTHTAPKPIVKDLNVGDELLFPHDVMISQTGAIYRLSISSTSSITLRVTLRPVGG